MVLAKVEVIVHNVVPCPRESTVSSIVCPVVLQVGVIERTTLRVNVTLEVTLAIRVVVWRECSLECKTLDDIEVQVNITQCTPCTTFLVC